MILHNIGYVFTFVSLSTKISINERVADKQSHQQVEMDSAVKYDGEQQSNEEGASI